MSKGFQLILFLAIFGGISAFGWKSDDEETVKIGNLYWTTTNCIVDEFANGDEIPQAKNYEEWKNAYENKLPVWCYYLYDKSNMSYGKMYNFHALIDKRGLAPKGYRLPERVDWENLIKTLGGAKKALSHIKSKHGWKLDKNGDNSSGFNCQPFGFYQVVSADNLPTDNFNGMGYSTGFWGIQMKSGQAYGNLIEVNAVGKIKINSDSRGVGAYLRLIKL